MGNILQMIFSCMYFFISISLMFVPDVHGFSDWSRPSTNHLSQWMAPSRWRHNGRVSVSNHQPNDCLVDRLCRRRWKKTSKHRVTGLCAGNSPGTGEFPAQMASNSENVSIWWRHQVSFCWCIYVPPGPVELNYNYYLMKRSSHTVYVYTTRQLWQVNFKSWRPSAHFYLVLCVK